MLAEFISLILKMTYDQIKAYSLLEQVRHSLMTMGGLVATDRPDLHNLDTDKDKNTVWEIDTQNEIAMVDEAMAALRHIHRSVDGKSDACEICGHDIRHGIHDAALGGKRQ